MKTPVFTYLTFTGVAREPEIICKDPRHFIIKMHSLDDGGESNTLQRWSTQRTPCVDARFERLVPSVLEEFSQKCPRLSTGMVDCHSIDRTTFGDIVVAIATNIPSVVHRNVPKLTCEGDVLVVHR